MKSNKLEVSSARDPVIIIGAGFTGLSAGYELCKQGIPVLILESDSKIGGLAASIATSGVDVEKFYHHWFQNDQDIFGLISELGLTDKIVLRPSRMATFYANDLFRLNSVVDLLRYKPLSFFGRIRLALMALKARRVKEWESLESLTASEWILDIAGKEVHDTIWWPLLVGKFGEYAADVSAVWLWNKLKLRAVNRNVSGQENLMYFEGGFSSLTEHIHEYIESNGGEVLLDTPATGLGVTAKQVTGVYSKEKFFKASAVINTTAPELFANLLQHHSLPAYTKWLEKIKYLGNICLLLFLERSLTSTYWMNVSDPDFPFVGIIEHTNFETSDNYGGQHLVYLSKYLPTSSALFKMSDDEYFHYCIPFIQKIVPDFNEEWIIRYQVNRADYAQPIIERHYGSKKPAYVSPINSLYNASMAHIYPEDRGTNYAVREGREIARLSLDADKTIQPQHGS